MLIRYYKKVGHEIVVFSQNTSAVLMMLFMQTKLVFLLLTNYQLFHDFLNEIDTSRSPGHPGVQRSYKPGMKYVSGNRDVPVYRDHINRA